MGENHKENILKCLKDWHSITLMQGKALSEGNIKEFEKLTAASVTLQARLDKLLIQIKPAKLNKECMNLLTLIKNHQDDLLTEITRGARELSKAIATLTKNTSSLKGYRQNRSSPPRFKSERA
jgi:hypothetical protein